MTSCRHLLLLLALLTALTVRGQRNDALDDVLQHMPLAACYVLKASDVPCASSWQQLVLTGLAAYGLSAATTYTLKQTIAERRPDYSDRRSFPSGHATFAFAGATMLRHEYGRVSPWVTIGGYGVASAVSLDRLRLDRHYLHDVCAGAAVGVLSTELTYYVRRRWLSNSNVDLGFTGQSLWLSLRW